MTHPPAAARLQALAAALLFSTGGVAIKSCGLTTWQIAGFRCGVAAITMALLLPAARRRWTRKTILVGIAYAATLVLYVASNKTTTAANAIFLQSTAPLYVLMLSPMLLGERTRRRDLLTMVGLAIGMALFFIGQEAPMATAPNPALGNLLATCAGLSWALTVLGLRWIARTDESGGESQVAVVVGNCVALAACLPAALPVTESTPTDWLWVLYLGVFQIAAAYILLTRALASASAFEVSLLLLIDPVVTPIWAWWIHGEVPGAWALAGGAVVVGVTLIKVLMDVRDDEGKPDG